MLNMLYFDIVALYTGLIIIMLIVLSMRVALKRKSTRTLIGDGGDLTLGLRMRAQGNFVEYAPFFLIGLVVMAYLGAGAFWMHVAGITFLIARIIHAYAMTSGILILRPVGMIGTFGVLLAQALFFIVKALT